MTRPRRLRVSDARSKLRSHEKTALSRRFAGSGRSLFRRRLAAFNSWPGRWVDGAWDAVGGAAEAAAVERLGSGEMSQEW